jgi:hypothetical protein
MTLRKFWQHVAAEGMKESPPYKFYPNPFGPASGGSVICSGGVSRVEGGCSNQAIRNHRVRRYRCCPCGAGREVPRPRRGCQEAAVGMALESLRTRLTNLPVNHAAWWITTTSRNCCESQHHSQERREQNLAGDECAHT